MNLNFLKTFILESGIPIQNWQRKLYSLKNKHKGKKCILIGNGPSVTHSDLDKINELDCIKFVFNRFHKVYTAIKFDPDYTMSVDPLFIDDFLSELLNEHKGQLLLGHHRKLAKEGTYSWFKVKTAGKFEFSTNPLMYISPGGSVVVAALQIAYYMGCREFYVYGVDHSFVSKSLQGGINENKDSLLVEGEGNHFIKNYRSDKAWYPPNTDEIETAFLKSRFFIESKGGCLVNISRRTELKELSIMNFDKFVKSLKH